MWEMFKCRCFCVKSEESTFGNRISFRVITVKSDGVKLKKQRLTDELGNHSTAFIFTLSILLAGLVFTFSASHRAHGRSSTHTQHLLRPEEI